MAGMARFIRQTTAHVVLLVVGMGSAPLLAQNCPDLVGRVPYGPARAVDVFGDHVYYSSGSMLMIADVSDPAVPIVVGELQMPDLIRDIRVAVSMWSAAMEDICWSMWGSRRRPRSWARTSPEQSPDGSGQLVSRYPEIWYSFPILSRV